MGINISLFMRIKEVDKYSTGGEQKGAKGGLGVSDFMKRGGYQYGGKQKIKNSGTARIKSEGGG